MSIRSLDSTQLGMDNDWIGNNAAFKCPLCGKIFIVSAMLHKNGRKCPNCDKSIGYCKGGKNSGGSAVIKW